MTFVENSSGAGRRKHVQEPKFMSSNTFTADSSQILAHWLALGEQACSPRKIQRGTKVSALKEQ